MRVAAIPVGLLIGVSLLTGPGCGGEEGASEASYEDQQLCMNEAERAYKRLTGAGSVRFFDSDAYYHASKDCRDADFAGFPNAAVREEREANREVERQRRQRELEQRQDELEQQEAARENREHERREAALEEEWDRLGCGGVDSQLSAAETRRCDELSSEAP